MTRWARRGGGPLLLALSLLASGALALPLEPPPSQSLSGFVAVHATATSFFAVADPSQYEPEYLYSVCIDSVTIHVEGDGTTGPVNETVRLDLGEHPGLSVNGHETPIVSPLLGKLAASGDGLTCVLVADPDVAAALVALIDGSGDGPHAEPMRTSSQEPGGLSGVQDGDPHPFVFTVSFSFSDGCVPSGSFRASITRPKDGSTWLESPSSVTAPVDVCETERAAGLPTLSPADALGLAWGTVEGMLAQVPHPSPPPAPPDAPSALPSPTPPDVPPPPSVDPGAPTTNASNTLTLVPDEATLSDQIESAGIVNGKAAATVAPPVGAPLPSAPPAIPQRSAPAPLAEDAIGGVPRSSSAAPPSGVPLGHAATTPPTRGPAPGGGTMASSVEPAAPPARLPAVAVVALAAVALGAAAWAALLALRGRLALRDDPLHHPVRRALHDALRERPGSSTTELAKLLGVHHTTVRHHGLALRRVGIVVAREVGGRTRFHLAGTPRGASAAVARAALANGTARAIFDAVVRAPGLRPSQLASAAGTSHETACYHVRRLARMGLVDARVEGGGRRVYPAP